MWYLHIQLMIVVAEFICVQLSVTSQTVAHQVPPSMGFSILEY